MIFIESEVFHTVQKKGLIGKLTAFLHIMLAVWKHDKRHETDRQMLIRVGSKFTVLFSIILMYDPLVDLLLKFFFVVFELIHLFFAVIEQLIEGILKYTLQTSHHQSEIIIVYSVTIVAIYVFYRLSRAAPVLIFRCKRYYQAVWLRYIRHESSCWREQPFDRKLKLVGTYTVGLSSLLFGFAL